MKIKKSHLTFYFFALIGLLISFSGYYILPERFFNDANIIIHDMHHEIGYRKAYPLTILFYNITKLKYLSFPIIGVIQYSVLIFIFYRIGVYANFHKLTIKNIIVYISFLMIAIFISMPTKEVINFLFIAIIVNMFSKRSYKLTKLLVISFILFLTFGYFFRMYYVFIPIISLLMYLTSQIKLKNKRVFLIVSGLMVLIFLSLSLGVIKGEFISESTRYDLNKYRIEKKSQSANSMIISPIEPTTWYGESFGTVYGFVVVNIPFNAFKYLFSPQILVFSIWQIFLFIILYKKLKRSINEGHKKNYELWLFFFLFSYFIIQGIFEPDLGSAVRHKAGIFPMIYYLLNYEDFRKKLR